MMRNVGNVIQYSAHTHSKAEPLHENTHELNSKCVLKSATQEINY